MNNKIKCEKIKELIVNNIIPVYSLGEKELKLLIAYETESIAQSDAEPDMTFLSDCYKALEKYENESPVLSEQEHKAIAEKAYEKYKSAPAGKHVPTKRIIAVIAAVVAIICILSATSYADFDPFSKFFSDIRDLLKMKSGDTIRVGDSELTVYGDVVYSSIEEAEKSLGISIYRYHNNDNYKIKYIFLIETPNRNYLKIDYSNGEKMIHELIYFDNSPGSEDDYRKHIDSVVINNLTFYVIKNDMNYQFELFNNGYLYSVLTPEYDDFMDFLGQ